MRITLIADTFSVQKGTGIARYCRELLEGLTSGGVEVEAVAPRAPDVPLGLAVNHALRMPYLARRAAGRSDLVHATSPITALAFPAVSKPKVLTYHDLVSLLGGTTGTSVLARVFAPLFLRMGHCADRAIADSSLTKDELTSHLGISPAKIRVVHLGVADIFQQQRRDKGPPFVIGYVGALNPRKALPYLFRTARILLDHHRQLPFRLEICGSLTHDRGSLTELVAQLGLDHITEFKGALTDEQLVAAYNSFDVFLLPSEWEGFGLPILEAQRCGVPVIVREDAHIPPEVSKCCVKVASEADAAEKICQLLTDPGMRLSVTEQGLDYSSQFTWHRTVRETVEVYEELLAHGTKHP
jgi:glycosyltransferase involved in cell wall biosynthesis